MSQIKKLARAVKTLIVWTKVLAFSIIVFSIGLLLFCIGGDVRILFVAIAFLVGLIGFLIVTTIMEEL